MRQGYDYLYSLLMFGSKVGIETTRKLLARLGSPEEAFRTVHVVGTNGKGSTSLYLARILEAHGFKVLLFTSPHLVSVRERLRVNGVPISEGEFDSALLKVKAAAEELGICATFFETLTLAALWFARECGVDFFVAEAGLGGRYDATAAAFGELAVLTGIGLEHTAILGDTEEKILAEKMAVLKKGKKLVRCKFQGTLEAEAKRLAQEGGLLELPLEGPELPKLRNIGTHYAENATLAWTAAHEMLGGSFKAKLATSALETAFWPGRMQILKDEAGRVRFILDGAHNPHAVRRLAMTLSEEFPGERFHTVFGALKDKDLADMVELLSPHVKIWHAARTENDRFREPAEVSAELARLGCEAGFGGLLSRDFLAEVSAEAGASPVLITGSLYLIGRAIELLKNDFAELEFFRNLTPDSNEHHLPKMG